MNTIVIHFGTDSLTFINGLISHMKHTWHQIVMCQLSDNVPSQVWNIDSIIYSCFRLICWSRFDEGSNPCAQIISTLFQISSKNIFSHKFFYWMQMSPSPHRLRLKRKARKRRLNYRVTKYGEISCSISIQIAMQFVKIFRTIIKCILILFLYFVI